MDRREFIRSSLIKTPVGLIALNEVLGPGMLCSGVRLVTASELNCTTAQCTITPGAVSLNSGPCTWTLTYRAGANGLPLPWALVVRCPGQIDACHLLNVESSFPHFDPVVTLKQCLNRDCVIWIQSGNRALPPGDTLTITLHNYHPPLTSTNCAFSVLEMDPKGHEPEIGSGLTFMEVPAVGGEVTPLVTARIHVAIPTRTQVAKAMKIKLAALDSGDHGTPNFTGTVQLQANILFSGLPASVDFTAADKGSLTLEATPRAPGIIRINATGPGFIHGSSNPSVCTDTAPEDQILWGDYHNHTIHCDGFLQPGEKYDHGRRFALLDWGMLSSHDMKPFPKRGARNWPILHAATEAAHEDGDFITFQGYEWSPPPRLDSARGHKVVIFLNPDHLLPVIPYTYDVSSPHKMVPPTTLIDWLIKRARKDVMVIPHHLHLNRWWNFPAVESSEIGGPLPAPAESTVQEIQPVAEIFSKVHGNCESSDLQHWIKPPSTLGFPTGPTFWQDGLKAGIRAGAVCAGDNHNDFMGCPKSSALTAVLAPGLSREEIFRAIQKRRTYGTSGPRIFIDFRIGQAKLGDIITYVPGSGPPCIEAAAVSPLPIDKVEVVKVTPGVAQAAHTHWVNGDKETSFTWSDPFYSPVVWVCYYLRIHMDDDTHGAWTSPIWLETAPGPP